MNVPEQVEKEIDDMCSALEKGRNDLEKKFRSLLEEFVDDSFRKFDSYIQDSARYDYQSWIRQTCNEIINSLLSGETKYLEDQWIISEYNWEKVQKIRLAIWKSAGNDIENCIINTLQREIDELKKENKRLRQYI